MKVILKFEQDELEKIRKHCSDERTCGHCKYNHECSIIQEKFSKPTYAMDWTDEDIKDMYDEQRQIQI